ncbi:MAG TPA: hypothetical protein VGM81_10800 [Burkholderiaceae bacterium]|jgi:hypothetical protein
MKLIECLGRPVEGWDPNDGIWLPTETDLGNLAVKHLRLMELLAHVNVRLCQLEEVRSGNNGPSDFTTPSVARVDLMQEEIVYWLRRAADEVIGLDSVVNAWSKSGRWPNSVNPDCIGQLLGNEAALAPFADSREFLRCLNDISNAHKHSFFAAQVRPFGARQGLVLAIGLKRNDLDNELETLSTDLGELVEGFNRFFKVTTDRLLEAKLPPPSLYVRSFGEPIEEVWEFPIRTITGKTDC